ncbi:hypothetical protein B0H15DRAFT_951701 [Mycena belliarum]|uniref:Uncharacterized protein n=1 Tax=Mycena belliarum TaxID=1033014 RepID=A0AAD6TYQ6_9AGAR|nr:hypothetical protein B0H15DRAFT_951701 [Mycena belliae]
MHPTISPAATRVRKIHKLTGISPAATRIRKKRKVTEEPESSRAAPEPPRSRAPSEPPRETSPGAKADFERPECTENTAEGSTPSEWDPSAMNAAWQALIDELKANKGPLVPLEQALTLGTEYYTLDENGAIEPGEPNTIIIEVGPGWEAKSRSFENSKYLLGKCSVDKAERSTLLTKSMGPGARRDVLEVAPPTSRLPLDADHSPQAIRPASGSASFKDPMDFELTEEPEVDDGDEMDWWK